MSRRSFVVELDDMLKKRAIEAHLKRPVDPVVLTTEAGVVQGLYAAMQLYEEVTRSNSKED